MSQKADILCMLRQKIWVCSTEFQKAYIPEFRSRLSELKKEGYYIVSQPCKRHVHKGQINEWRLAVMATTVKEVCGVKPCYLREKFNTCSCPQIIKNSLF